MPPTRQQYTSTPTEADTCRTYVVPKLQTVGWDTEPHSIAEQRQFTAGRIIVAGTRAKRLEARKADYLLRYTPDFTIAVVEAKAEHKLPADGLQQAKAYAQTLDLKFAYVPPVGQNIPNFHYCSAVQWDVYRKYRLVTEESNGRWDLC